MRIKSLIFIVFVLFSAFAGGANAVTVSVVPGKSVGLGDSFYWAGLVTLNIDGKEYPAMATDGGAAAFQNPRERLIYSC